MTTPERQIYLIRHLPTKYNGKGVYIGRSIDPDILQESIPQFTEKLEQLKGSIDLSNPLLYSSPARRCIQTIEIVKKHFGIEDTKVNIDPDFQETDFGLASGLTVAQIKEKFPGVYSAWTNDQSKTQFPEGESYNDVQARAWGALEKALEGVGAFSSLIVCAHVDVMKMILFKVTDTPISSKKLIVIPNGGICVLVTSGRELKLLLK